MLSLDQEERSVNMEVLLFFSGNNQMRVNIREILFLWDQQLCSRNKPTQELPVTSISITQALVSTQYGLQDYPRRESMVPASLSVRSDPGVFIIGTSKIQRTVQ